MKKLYFLILPAFYLACGYGQVNTYSFNSSAGTYVPITGGTLISYGQPVSNSTTADGVANLAGEAYFNRPIGFNFTYNSIDYNSFGFSTSGFLLLGSASNYAATTTPISQVSGYNNLVAAGSGDLAGGNTFTGNISTGSNVFTVTSGNTSNVSIGDSILGEPVGATVITGITATTITLGTTAIYPVSGAVYQVKNGSIRYETIGAAPNRILVLQYNKFTRYGRPDNYMNFQIRLYETSNRIETVYDWSTTYTGTASALQLGLKGIGNTDYFNRTTTTSWTASTAGATNTATMRFNNTVLPSSGLTYSWLPNTCSRPSSFSSNVSYNSAVINWNAITDATGYEYELRTSGAAGSGSTGLAQSGSQVANSISLSSLSASTAYSMYVRTNCGAGNFSGWSIAHTFTTICNPVTSFAENFDAVTTPALPACWKSLGLSPSTSTTQSRSAPNSLYLISTNGYLVVTLPPVSNAGAGTHRLKLWAKPTVLGSTDSLELGYLTNPAIASSFIKIQHVLVKGDDFRPYIFLPGTAAGSNLVLALRSAEGQPVFIDDVKWEPFPACYEASSPVASLITYNSATISWTAASPAPANYELYRSTSAAIPNAATVPTYTGIGSTSFSLTGLSPVTTYYVWVRSNCGANGNSEWSAKAVFTSLCTPIAALPWTENIDALSTVGPNSFPPCWKNGNDAWQTVNNDSEIGDPNALSSPNFLEFDAGRDTSFTWMPSFSLVGGTTYKFSFWVAANNDYGWTLGVYYNHYPAREGAVRIGTNIFTRSEVIPFAWQKKTIYFTPPSTGTYFLGFFGESGHAFDQMAFDDISLEQPGCAPPYNIQFSAINPAHATIAWSTSGNSAAANFDVYISTSSTAPTAGTTPTAAAVTSPYTATALIPDTKYYVWVRTNCGGPTPSDWTLSKDFITSCYPVPFPYTQDFSGSNTSLPPCMERENLNEDGSSWAIGSFAPGPVVNYAATLNANASYWRESNDWLFLPPFDLTAGTSYTLKFKSWAHNGTPHKFEIKYGVSARSIDMQGPPIYSETNALGLQTVQVAFTPSSSRAWTIGIYVFSDPNDSTFAIDDVEFYATGTIPVTLLRFDGAKIADKNLLTWTTSSEQNNKGFYIERSPDGRNFSSLDFIGSGALNGNSTIPVQYRYTDQMPYTGNNFYRLRQIDLDGRSNYSQVVWLKGEAMFPAMINLYPNPVHSDLRLQLMSSVKQKARLQLTDMTGKILYATDKVLVPGQNNISLNIQQLAAGNYLLTVLDPVSGAALCELKKFVKLDR